MIRILSIEQALSLKGKIPDLAILRSQQFQGEGYEPEEHGHIIVIQKRDDLYSHLSVKTLQEASESVSDMIKDASNS